MGYWLYSFGRSVSALSFARFFSANITDMYTVTNIINNTVYNRVAYDIIMFKVYTVIKYYLLLIRDKTSGKKWRRWALLVEATRDGSFRELKKVKSTPESYKL